MSEASVDDPLFLHGCRIDVVWERRRQGVVFDVRACSGTLEHSPQPGKRRRYIFHREAQEDLTARAMPTNFRKLKRRKYEVTASTRAVVKGTRRWTEVELQAARKRREARGEGGVPEIFKSIGLSLGRPTSSVRNKVRISTGEGYAPQPGGQAGIAQLRVDWRSRVRWAMERLPEQRGTMQDVCEMVEALPHVTLDRSLQAGNKSTEKWQMRVSKTLSRHPEFVQTGEKAANPKYADTPKEQSPRKTVAVWQYFPPIEGSGPAPPSAKQLNYILHGPKQKSAATATKKSLNTVKAFRK